MIAYLLDNKYVLRISKPALDVQIKQDRVKLVSYVPKIHSSGSFHASDREYYYLITEYVQGNDLWSVLQKLTDEQNILIGQDLVQFLTELHSITDSSYDIGHYIATVPRYKRSWKDGHLEYIHVLHKGLSEMKPPLISEKIISAAFDYLYSNINCLDYQTGPKLLHNDLHPKNIIVHEGRLAGVIDWECSQFGEADFELAHLFHWCIYPPTPGNTYGLLLRTIVENLGVVMNVPHIEKRLTIYQLEHELNQLIWSGKKHEEERVRRIKGWLSGSLRIF
ncbi:phosphotransferase [Gorillibacterium sp. sgz5001074]|uniref:phosphotransferase n=1 Tax=Gorillibacterium sp. sgz5001074 TaxID=3446695 RepID=UPI003F675075